MEDHAVPREVARSVKRKRQTFDDAMYEKTVTLARQHGSLVAAKKVNADRAPEDHITESTVRTWLSRWKKEGKFWESDRGKRGRPSALHAVPGASDEWEKQLDSLRAQGRSVTGRVAAVVARAVVEEKAPSLLERHGGAVKFSVATGGRLLAACDKSFRKRTSSRIIPPDADVEVARDTFYAQIKDAFPDDFPDPSLVVNYDETFHLYNPNRGYTWEKRGASRVQLTESKDGFTLLPVVAANAMVGAQLIFGGSTAAVLPRLPPGPFLQYAFTDSHWSNEGTVLSLWKEMIVPYINRTRTALGDDNAPALVLADAYPAHWSPRVTEFVASVQGVVYVAIPDSLTHLFQPLDLGIIAALKQTIQRRKDEFLEKEVATAVRENRAVLLSKSRPVLRENVTMWIKEAVADEHICAERCCISGFARAGIMRLLYGHDQVSPDVDTVIPPRRCDECGELGFMCHELPNCEHFQNVESACLCDGCLHNHRNMCS